MADWEIYDGKQIQGPFSEDGLASSFRQGMPSTIMVRPVGSADWSSPMAHAPFAYAVSLAVKPPPVAPVPVTQTVIVNSAPARSSWCGLLVILILVITIGPCVCAGLMK